MAALACALPVRGDEPGARTRKRDWDTAPDTWSATDGLGRTLPGYDEAGPPRKGKFVGIFYFLWLGEHGTDGPYDVSKIRAARAFARPNEKPPSSSATWISPPALTQ